MVELKATRGGHSPSACEGAMMRNSKVWRLMFAVLVGACLLGAAPSWAGCAKGG
jgi:hypothetical protein